MEESINNKGRTKLLLKLNFIFISLLVVFLLPNLSFATEENNSNEFIYLSDIPYDTRQSRAGWGSIHINRTESGSDFSVKVQGGFYSFSKGIWAHASSQVVYNITDYQGYDYFTTYMGVNSSSGNNGNGVKFKIYTSEDGSNWTLRTDENPPAIKSSNDALFVKISLQNVKFIKLEANDNGANGNDHSVYVDAKLIKSTYKEPGTDLVPTIEELDREIKTTFADSDLTNEKYKLTLLKRELINRVGEYGLRRFFLGSEINKETYEWLTSDVNVLETFILGGQPEGGYYNTLTQLTRLYEAHKDDFKITETTKYGTVLGDLYTRMAIAVSLTHSQTFGLWIQSGGENKTDAVKRYEIYKDMHKNGNFVLLRNEDGTPKLKEDGTPQLDITQWFENYSVEEMRYIFNNLSDDEETLWLNEYTQSFVDQYPNEYGKYTSPHPYMDYRNENLNQPEFYDPAKKDEWDAHFKGLFSKYNVTYREGLKKIWMFLRNPIVNTGAVCGGISKVGSSIRTSHGIPCVVIGQPGHAAMIYYWQNADGKGYWNLDNDVSGWTLSERGERLLLGWGNASSNYARGSFQVVYMLLAQEALNDYENLVKAEELVYLANVYNSDLADETKKQATLEKQEEIYREALKIQPINIDAWLGLINVYNANKNKTEDDFYNLSAELAEKLECFPLPMYNLTNLIKPKLTSVENSYKFTLLQTRTLTEASNLPNTATDKVLQPSITRTEANFLLGKVDKTIATFSFDGEDAGKIVLSSRFDGIGVRWDYCLTGKDGHDNWEDANWNEVTFSAEEEHKLQLTPKELASITAENDIYVHIVGVGYEEENLYKIDISENVINENMYYANDLENRVIGVNLTCEWRNSEDDPWTSYAVTSPNNTGNKTLQIRQAANGTKLASNILTFTFTEDNQPDTRKYIPVSHLSIHDVSTQATNNQGSATNAIDANYNTRWHSAWDGTDTHRFIVIKLDKSVALSAVEFVPAGGGNGKIVDGKVYGSMDGEKWEELSSLTNLTYTNQANSNQEAKDNTKAFEIAEPKDVQYVKIEASRATNGNWFTARAFNLYQDLTKNPHPTAGIGYSTTKLTNGNVVARLVNPSTEIRITNNNGNDTYIFTENGNFTFEFVDTKGNTGSATAKVDWIDKVIPTAEVRYSITEKTDKEVIATLVNESEPITIVNNSGNREYTFDKNGEHTFEFVDEAGNVGKATAKVDWIIEDETITSDVYTVEKDCISVKMTTLQKDKGIKLKEFKENISSGKEYVVLDKEGNAVSEEDIIKTGMKLKVGEKEEYVIILSGDVDCDGILTVNDLAQMKLHIIESIVLTDISLKSADIDNDTEFTINDIAKMKLILIE